MKRSTLVFSSFTFLLLLCFSHPLLGEGGRGSRGMVPYSADTVSTIKGTVGRVDTVFNPVTKEDGLHLAIRTASGKYIVHVCPQWYAEKQRIRFAVGETVEVIGSTFIKDNEQNIYAATIVGNSSERLELRDTRTGDGRWSGRYMNERQSRNRQKGRRQLGKGMRSGKKR